MVVAQMLQAAKPRTILEVGSFLGFSSRWILEISRSWGAEVVVVDAGIRHRVFDNVQEHLLAFSRAFVEQGALTVVRAFFAVPTLAELKDLFDFYFIDGEHSFDSTRSSVCGEMKNGDVRSVVYFLLASGVPRKHLFWRRPSTLVTLDWGRRTSRNQ